MTEVKTATTAKSKGKITVQNVYGPMVHQLNGRVIDGPTEFDEIDFFIQAQLDSGKLVKVEQ